MRRRFAAALLLTLATSSLAGCAAYVEPGPVVYRPYYYDPYCSYGPSVVVVNRGYYGGYHGGYYASYHRYR